MDETTLLLVGVVVAVVLPALVPPIDILVVLGRPATPEYPELVEDT